MASLPELHEATLLWTLRERYNENQIYVRHNFKKNSHNVDKYWTDDYISEPLPETANLHR